MKNFKKYSSALRDKTRQWIDELRDIDILIGIPCWNNEDTIGHVISTAGKALAENLHDYKAAIFVSDGGSLDDTREMARAANIPAGVQRHVSIYRGMPGKGTSFRAVFEATKNLKAGVCVVVDSDLRSITPEWIVQLAKPILDGKFDYLAPHYLRHKFDGTITNHIVYPFTRALYGKRIRQPIGGDFGFKGDLASCYIAEDVWTTDVAQFGIDIWMTTSAINEGCRMGQVDLGVKIHDAKDPSTDLSPMFYQVVSTMFYLMGKYESEWKSVTSSVEVPIMGGVENNRRPEAVAVKRSKLISELKDGFQYFRPLYEQVLERDNFEGLESVVRQATETGRVDWPPDLWARIIYDFAFTYQSWNRNRRRMVSIMAPLYFGRVGAFTCEVDELDSAQAEEIILKQADIFEQEKGYLREKFERWEE